MERYMEIAIVCEQCSYMVETLEELNHTLNWLKTKFEKVVRIEMRCYERKKGEIFEMGECICKQVIG